MTHFNFKSKEDVLLHLRAVKQRKRLWQEKAIADYNKLMEGTEEERKAISLF